MKSPKLAILSIVAVTIAAGLPALADQPATRPASAPQAALLHPESPRARMQQLRQLLHGLAGGNTSNVHPFTQQEWDDMMSFLEENSHARWYVLSNMHLPDNSPIRLGAMREWRNYNFTREHFPAVAEQMLKRFQLEDDLFGLTIKAVSTMQDPDEIRELIHNKIAEIVKLDLNERELRIDKLQKLLDAEKQSLDHDQMMEEQVIDQRTNNMMARLQRMNAASTQPSATTQPSGALASEPNDAASSAKDPVVNTSNDDQTAAGK